MIIKILPIKVNNKGTSHGSWDPSALRKAVEHIQDPVRTAVLHNQSADVAAWREFLLLQRSPEISSRSRYIPDENRFDYNYISGYHCFPESVISDYKLAVAFYTNTPKGNIAYHIIQSFPKNLDIPNVLVHQCGLELCQKLKLYPAIVCSHVNPIKDDDGTTNDVPKYNHIIFCAYPSPFASDPQKKDPVKYHDCKESRRQLRKWNDEIALAHGLPIIRNPDDLFPNTTDDITQCH